MPTLVYFRDLKDPTSVKKVDPNNLSEVFGEGVRLVSVTIEMTDKPVTWGIEKKLPWLNKEQTFVQIMRDLKNSPLNLYHSNFKRTR